MNNFFSLKITNFTWIFLGVVLFIISLPSFLWVNLKISDASNKKTLRVAFDQISLPPSLSAKSYTYDSRKDLDAPDGSWVYRFKLNESLNQTLSELKSSFQKGGYTITENPNNSDAYISAVNSIKKTEFYTHPDFNNSIKIVQYKLVDTGTSNGVKNE